MMLADEPNIREVILFPLTQQGEDLLMGAPAEITAGAVEGVVTEDRSAAETGSVGFARRRRAHEGSRGARFRCHGRVGADRVEGRR